MTGDRWRKKVDIDKPTGWLKLKWRRWHRRIISRLTRREIQTEMAEHK